MRVKCFFICLASFSFLAIYPGFLQAQYRSVRSRSNVSLRLLAGVNQSKFNYQWEDPSTLIGVEDFEEWHKYYTGICAGFGLETKGRLGFIFEILYHQKGDRVDFEDEEDFIKSSDIVHELSVPLLLQLNFLPNSGPYLLAGGEVGLVLAAINRHETYFDLGENGHDVHYSKGSENITKKLNRINYGIVLGAGFRFDFRGQAIFTELRYHNGLADLAKNEVKTNPGDQMKTNSIVFILGYSR